MRTPRKSGTLLDDPVIFQTFPSHRRMIRDENGAGAVALLSLLDTLERAELVREWITGQEVDKLTAWVIRAGVTLKTIARGDPIDIGPLIDEWPSVVLMMRRDR